MSDPNTVDLSALRGQIAAYKAIDAQMKVLADNKATLRADIEQALGDHEIGQLDGHTVATWKRSKRNALNQSALRKDHPELVAEYTTATEVRTFKVVE